MLDSIRGAMLASAQYLATIGVSDIVDIAIVACIIFGFVLLIKKTGSTRVAKGVLLLLAAMWLASQLKLNVISFLLQRTFEVGLIAIVILFRPELRRILDKMGSGKLLNILGRPPGEQSMENAITQVVLAVSAMSDAKIGALIIFERETPLNDAINTGTSMRAEVSSELLRNIFFPNAPLHDGALIIRDGVIAAAGCMLPLSTNSNLSRDLGMRHRAGIGMSESSDAVVVVVSEETGGISVAVDGMLKRNLSRQTFDAILMGELLPRESGGRAAKYLRIFKGNSDAKKDIPR